MPSIWKSNTLGLMSIAVSLIALINPKYRLIAGIILAGAIVFYIITSFLNDIDEYGERIKKLEEKLEVHTLLIDLKSEISSLKRALSNHGDHE